MRRLAKRRARGIPVGSWIETGKIIAYVCTALSAATMLGISIIVIGAPWIGLGTSSAQSEQAKTSAEAAGKQLAKVRALAATVSGIPSETPQGGTGTAVEAGSGMVSNRGRRRPHAMCEPACSHQRGSDPPRAGSLQRLRHAGAGAPAQHRRQDKSRSILPSS